MNKHDADHLVAFRRTIEDAGKMKARMLEQTIFAAKVKCTRCDGMLHGRISGPRKHFRMWCDGSCQRQFME
jgi:hypothetical protein